MKPDAESELAGSAEDVSTVTKLRRSPLTDPRALVRSLVVHALLLAMASVLAFRVVVPGGESGPGRTLARRAGGDRQPGEGRHRRAAVGDPEGRAADVSAEAGVPAPPTRDPAADALISEILPTRDSAEMTAQTLPGPSTSGLGMLNGTGSGEGAGQGGAVVGGGGKGTGPGTEFFGIRDRGSSFAYVIDCSGSMTARGSLDVAKRELLASLGRISPDARFAVVFYNLEAKVFTDPTGNAGMMAATPSNKARVRTLLSGVQPDGGTDHMLALRTAFNLQPEVIFFLTDADLMTRQDVAELLAQAGKTRIQAVEFGQVTGLGGSAPSSSWRGRPAARIAISTSIRSGSKKRMAGLIIMATGPYYRGGSSLRPRLDEVRVDRLTGLLKPMRGVSVYDRSDHPNLTRLGGAHLLGPLPDRLAMI